ncbi:MAG: hypothetical protein JWM74_3747 [Myxococcaceae bacterium]|nr:hypothetical protein [Myxococcaceae bacterium]
MQLTSKAPMGTRTKCLLKVTRAQIARRCAVSRVVLEASAIDGPPERMADRVERRVRFEARSADDGFFFGELEDGSDVSTGLRFFDPEPILAMNIATLLACVLELHDDPRGVFVFPNTADPVAARYEDRVFELRHVGRFVPASALTAPHVAMNDEIRLTNGLRWRLIP